MMFWETVTADCCFCGTRHSVFQMLLRKGLTGMGVNAHPLLVCVLLRKGLEGRACPLRSNEGAADAGTLESLTAAVFKTAGGTPCSL